MKSNDDFLQRLRIRKKDHMEIGLIDDNTRDLDKHINEKVSCVVNDIPLKDAVSAIQESRFRRDMLSHDILFWDGSFIDEDGISAVATLENLIERDPEFAKKSMVLLGTDIIRFAESSNPVTRRTFARVQRLPHIIFGDNRGTKVDNMLKHMKMVAERDFIELPDRLPDGICRKEILDIVGPLLKKISRNTKGQMDLGLDLEDAVKDLKPENEEERSLLENARRVAELLQSSSHSISHPFSRLCSSYSRNEDKLNEADKNEEGRE